MSIIAPAEDRLHTAREAQERIGQATTIDELREAFRDHYGLLGWRVLCRMAFLGQGAEKALRLE